MAARKTLGQAAEELGMSDPNGLVSGKNGSDFLAPGTQPKISGHSSAREIPVTPSHAMAFAGVTRRLPVSMWVMVASLTPNMDASSPWERLWAWR